MHLKKLFRIEIYPSLSFLPPFTSCYCRLIGANSSANVQIFFHNIFFSIDLDFFSQTYLLLQCGTITSQKCLIFVRQSSIGFTRPNNEWRSFIAIFRKIFGYFCHETNIWQELKENKCFLKFIKKGKPIKNCREMVGFKIF